MNVERITACLEKLEGEALFTGRRAETGVIPGRTIRSDCLFVIFIIRHLFI